MEKSMNKTIYILQASEEPIEDGKKFLIPESLRELLPNKLRLVRSALRLHGKNCLYVFTESEWEIFYNKLGELPKDNYQARKLMDFYLGSEYETDITDGELFVPQSLLIYMDCETASALYVSYAPKDMEHRNSDYLLWGN